MASTNPDDLVNWQLAEWRRRPPIRYVWGAEDPNHGMDCSGFEVAGLRALGWKVPRYSAETIWEWGVHAGTTIPIAEGLITPGALLLHREGAGMHHVGTSLGNKSSVEEANPHAGIIVASAVGRFEHAMRIPLLHYGPQAWPTPPAHHDPAPAPVDWAKLRRDIAASYLPSVGDLPVPMDAGHPVDALHTIFLQRCLQLIFPTAGVAQSGVYDQATTNGVTLFQNVVNAFHPNGITDADDAPGRLTQQTKFFLGITLRNISNGIG